MCVVLYLASDNPLQEIDWNAAAPCFHVLPASQTENSPNVSQLLARNFVYQANTYEQCGCAFEYTDTTPSDEEDAAEELKKRESLVALKEYLEMNLQQHESISGYAHVAGTSFPYPPITQRKITPEFFSGELFEFPLLTELIITRSVD